MLEIQLVTKNKIPSIVTLGKEIWEEHYINIIGKEQVSYMLKIYQSVEAITKQIEEGYQYYILYNQENMIGYIGVLKEKEDLFLSKLYIKKEYRGLGFSKQVLHFLKEYAKINAITRIYLTCNKHNDSSLKAYQHLGFNKIGAVVNDIGEGYVMDDYILEIIL